MNHRLLATYLKQVAGLDQHKLPPLVSRAAHMSYAR